MVMPAREKAMKSFHLGIASSRAALWLAVAWFVFLVDLASAQDQDHCRPYKWDSLQGFSAAADPAVPADPEPTEGTLIVVQPGEVNCRDWRSTPAEVGYYTCWLLGRRYGLPKDKFFSLNPGLKRDCSNIKPKTEYCINGCQFSSESQADTC